MKKFITGSTVFFKEYKGFKGKDLDIILLQNNEAFKFVRRHSIPGTCIFEWNRKTPEEYINFCKKANFAKDLGAFITPEFCKEIGFTINHLKELKFLRDKIEKDILHNYIAIIYDSFIENNSFTLTEEQRLKAYEEYKKHRK